MGMMEIDGVLAGALAAEVEEAPWVPAALAAKLVPGAWVRVWLSPECPGYEALVPGSADAGDYHPKEMNEVSGVIVALGTSPETSHWFEVEFDQKIIYCDKLGDLNDAVGGWFAAAELEPIKEPAS